MLGNLLSTLIDDFHERPLPELLARERRLLRLPGRVSVVTGMRRAGKTWFCYQDMQTLLARGTPRERLLYLNFEDERLLPFTAGDFQAILDTYYRKFPALKNETCYFYLDEIQRIEGWELFVRRVLDTERIALCVTGSSSRLLSTEIASSLRGRAATTEIFPYSFREFVRLHCPQVDLAGRFGASARATLQNAAERYRRVGGFPEVQDLDDDVRRQVLRDHLDVVLLRDIVERYRVSNTIPLRLLIRSILGAPASRFSVNKFYHTLRSQGVSCTKNDLYDFLAHLADAYLIYLLPVHARSEKARQVNPRKVHAIDPGLLEAMSHRISEDRGAILETIVYMHLRRQRRDVEYYLSPTGSEVDLVAGAGQERELIQVCWSLEADATREREVGALRRAMAELSAVRATIVTWLDEEPADGGIAVVPAWRWLLAAE